MRRCVLCAYDREEVALTQVVPGIWTAFNSFVVICAACRETDAYKKLVKQKKVIARSQEAPASPPPASGPAE